MRASRDALFSLQQNAGHLHFTGTYKNRHRYERISRLRTRKPQKLVNRSSVYKN